MDPVSSTIRSSSCRIRSSRENVRLPERRTVRVTASATLSRHVLRCPCMSSLDRSRSACPAFAAMDVPPQRGPTANRDPKGVQRRTWTPRGSNGEHGPQGGPTANMDPTATIQPRGTQEHFASSTTTAYPGLTCSAGVYPPRKTPYIPRPRGINPRATEPDAKSSQGRGAEGRIAEENGGCQYILTLFTAAGPGGAEGRAREHAENARLGGLAAGRGRRAENGGNWGKAIGKRQTTMTKARSPFDSAALHSPRPCSGQAGQASARRLVGEGACPRKGTAWACHPAHHTARGGGGGWRGAD